MKHSKFLILVSVVCGLGMTAGCGNISSYLSASDSAKILNFDATKYVMHTKTAAGSTITVRAYENISYVAKPADPTTQIMNIYVPEAYFQGGRIGAYTAQTAPIFLPNFVGGYMPSRPGTLDGMPPPGTGAPGPPGMAAPNPLQGAGGPPDMPNTIAMALASGYVVATPGVRGRTSQGSDGRYTGKAPAAIVDLKAAVRYLRFNDARMPGDAEKIVSNGTSAGGALSALLGASGNSADYESALQALGAAPARDDIFAVSAYCPIANLEHADAAYEWQFNGIYDYKPRQDFRSQRSAVASTMTEQQIEVSKALKDLFPPYVNSLKLHGRGGELMSLDAAGNGSFRDYVKSLVKASAQKALNQGQDLSRFDWVNIDGCTVKDIDFGRHLIYMGRMKLPPAFDGLDLGTGENQLFGTERIDKRHFTAFAASHSTVSGAGLADAHTVGMMNPMSYVGKATNARHWRIRHGTNDKDTSLAISTMLALALENEGLAVDFALPWDRPHSGDYDLDELFAWIGWISTDPAAGKKGPAK